VRTTEEGGSLDTDVCMHILWYKSYRFFKIDGARTDNGVEPLRTFCKQERVNFVQTSFISKSWNKTSYSYNPAPEHRHTLNKCMIPTIHSHSAIKVQFSMCIDEKTLHW